MRLNSDRRKLKTCSKCLPRQQGMRYIKTSNDCQANHWCLHFVDIVEWPSLFKLFFIIRLDHLTFRGRGKSSLFLQATNNFSWLLITLFRWKFNVNEHSFLTFVRQVQYYVLCFTVNYYEATSIPKLFYMYMYLNYFF